MASNGTVGGTTSESKNEKPVVVIIGGLGYIGRFLALHIHKKELASEVRLVDKVLPQLARLPPEFNEACSQDKYMQADASRTQSLSRIFAFPSGRLPTYVFNCGGETRYSQDPSVYEVRSTTLTKNLANHCASLKPSPVLIEFGTGMVYKPASASTISSGGCTESAALKPWLKIARAKLAAEEALADIAKHGKLNYVVLRLAHVYGPYDVGFLARGLCLARVYQSQGKPMKWLYGASLRINTVHVSDICTAAWAAATYCSSYPPLSSSSSESLLTERAFNVVDDGDTSQQTLADLFSKIFNIETGFQGSIISQFAKLNLDNVVDDVNEDILQPWADLLKEAKLEEGRGSPLSPFMEKELLRDCDLSLSGAKSESILSWKCDKPKVTEEALREILASYKRVGWWP